ncbi:MAG TPA: glycosyltransferase family 4 protein [Bacteroidota bacterium]
MSQTPQRIAFVCFSRALGGLELSTIRLATVMRERGVETWIMAPPESPLALRAQESDITSIPLAPRWKYGDIFTARRLAHALKAHHIDAAIIMQSKDVHLASLASLFSLGTKFVFFQQMQSGFDKRGWVHTWVYSKLSLWVTLTQRMKQDVARFTRFPAKNVIVNPVGVELSKFDPSRYSAQDARRVLGLPEKGSFVGVLGRLDPQKGQEVLLQAAPKILQRFPDTVFVIVGDETAGERGYKARLFSLVGRLGIERSVVFLPFTEDVPRFMAALDVVVLPSFSETFGYVLIEAMAMEKPVVATNAGGVPEIIADSVTGLLVEPRDHPALALAILRILENKAFGASLGRSARSEALRRYDIRTCADELLKAITNVL